MSYSPLSDNENYFSPNPDQNNDKNKEYEHSCESNRDISEFSYRGSKFRNHNRYNNKYRGNKFHHVERSSYDQRKYSNYKGKKPYDPYHYLNSKYYSERRSSNEQQVFTRKYHDNTYKSYNETLTSVRPTTEVAKHDNKVKSKPEININPEVIDSLTKLSVNITSNDQILRDNKKVNVLHLPTTLPPSSTNTFDTEIQHTPIPTEPIKPGESFFKDKNYKNIKPSEIFSPTLIERPSKPVSKRPSVIKSNPTIDYPNRDLTEFQKLLKVGEGTYGTVYMSLDKRSNELVAIKRVIMHHEHEGFPITAVREIKILRQLNHKNVVNLREIISHQKDIFLVFEYMNHDLMGLLANEYVCFNEESILCIIKQILEGLQYCHAKNFLHRDLKCSNILLNNKGEVKLGDFGLSRFYDASLPGRPYTNKVISLWYRPIELLLGEESYGFAVDIWSCGCILAELFTRRALFHASSEIELLQMITDLCGTPSISDWPEVRKLPRYQTIEMKPKPRTLLHNYNQVIPNLALLLLDQMLMLNPMKRITASEALKSSWIIINGNSSTLDPMTLPSWIDCHELRANIMKKKR